MIAPPVIVLVRPQMAENIGMCARAMGNFGLTELRLVAPREGWPHRTRQKKGAWQAASGATGILERAALFGSVTEAVADLEFIYATTARERGQAKPVMGAETATASMAGAGERRTGVLFGPERTGLDNDEVSLADALITFPVDPTFASVNLAQSVLLVAYEWFKVARAGPAATAIRLETPPARRESVLSFFAFVEAELEKAGYFNVPEKRDVMARNLRNIFHRIGLTEQDVRTLRGVLGLLVRRRDD